MTSSSSQYASISGFDRSLQAQQARFTGGLSPASLMLAYQEQGIAGPALIMIENQTFDEMKVGDSASLVRALSKEDIELFAVMSGDVNPAHVDEEYARSDMFHKIIAHGMWGASLISTLLGTRLPGPGTIYLDQTLAFHRPVALGDTITVSVTVTSKEPEKHHVVVELPLR